MVKTYIKKTIVTAIRYTKENYGECIDFCRERFVACLDDTILIDTVEGQQNVELGDYIVKGVNGEIYSCKPYVFNVAFEEVKKYDNR